MHFAGIWKRFEGTDLQSTTSKVKSKTAWATQFVTILPYRKKKKKSRKEKAPPPEGEGGRGTHTHICAQSLSNAAHQLSSGCHNRRQPGRAIYSPSIQNAPWHFYWISHRQKGQLRWWVSVGGQLKETVPTRQTAPAERALPTVWARTCRWHHVSGAFRWMVATQVLCCKSEEWRELQDSRSEERTASKSSHSRKETLIFQYCVRKNNIFSACFLLLCNLSKWLFMQKKKTVHVYI